MAKLLTILASDEVDGYLDAAQVCLDNYRAAIAAERRFYDTIPVREAAE
jgi:hypothetical protein